MTNQEKYKTFKEGTEAFRAFCRYQNKNTCLGCPALEGDRYCFLNWLALEAEEELRSCPFCGSKDIKVIQTTVSGYVATCNDCWAASRAETTKADAIAAWNRRAK